MRASVPLLLCLGCLPAAPSLGEAAPRPDLGDPGDTWGEDDVPVWPDDGGDADGGGPADTSGTGDGDEADSDSGAPPDLPSLDPGLSDLRLTEVLVDPDGKDGALDGPELVELVNPTAQAVNLTGLVLEARSWPTTTAADLGLEGSSLMPGQRLAVLRFANDVELPPELPWVSESAITAGLRTGSGLRNADGGVLIRGAGGEIADMVIYGGPQPSPFDDPQAWVGAPADAAEPGASLCRAEEGVDSDAAADWAACPPTPGEAANADPPEPPVPQTGSIVITEVLANPVGSGSEEKLLEFVELENVDDHAIDLAAFTIADALSDDAPGIDPIEYAAGDGGCLPATCLAPGHRALIVGDSYVGERGGALVLATDDSTIANAGLGLVEPVVIRDGEGNILSTYRDWLDPQAEPNPSSQERSIHRSDAMAADEPGSWFMADPTPGT